MSQPAFKLACQACGERWPDDTEMEAVQLHMQVEHDTDKVELDLIAVCRCNAAMALTRSRALASGRVQDYFDCPACKRSSSAVRSADGGDLR